MQSVLKVFHVFSHSSRENRGEAEFFFICRGLHRERRIVSIILLYLSEDESLRQKERLVQEQCLPCSGGSVSHNALGG